MTGDSCVGIGTCNWIRSLREKESTLFDWALLDTKKKTNNTEIEIPAQMSEMLILLGVQLPVL